MENVNQVTFDYLFKILTPILCAVIGVLIKRDVGMMTKSLDKLEKRMESLVKESQEVRNDFNTRLTRLETLSEFRKNI